ncbi:sensor histidine kinase [Paenibacillus sp. NPDC058174]|uniref:sensor histidine kinase n=1 Tax=Paenibacillus sp. NPDC058174 TaxID=3346366 RepID=UPI0036DDB5D0
MMNLLHRIRSLLVAVPAVVTILSIGPGDYIGYTAYMLIALLIVRAGKLFPGITLPLLLAELFYFSWLASTYNGILFLLPFATLIGAFAAKPPAWTAFAWTLGGGVLLAVPLQAEEPKVITAILLLWLMTAGILAIGNANAAKQHQTEHLYDALALSHEELEAARRRLIDYASQIEQYAQLEERNRIAKDIHDDLGHRLIRVKMMSEAAIQLFDADTPRARTMIEQIRDQLQDSMERMRRTVRRLAAPEDSDSRRYALDRLVADSGEALGIEVGFTVQGDMQPIYPSIELILFLNAQEAITNAVRHGGASVVDVTLHFLGKSVALTIANNGALPKEPLAAGLGIRGMKERIALIGGRLEWRTEKRFEITTIIPLTGDAARRAETVQERSMQP